MFLFSLFPIRQNFVKYFLMASVTAAAVFVFMPSAPRTYADSCSPPQVECFNTPGWCSTPACNNDGDCSGYGAGALCQNAGTCTAFCQNGPSSPGGCPSGQISCSGSCQSPTCTTDDDCRPFGFGDSTCEYANTCGAFCQGHDTTYGCSGGMSSCTNPDNGAYVCCTNGCDSDPSHHTGGCYSGSSGGGTCGSDSDCPYGQSCYNGGTSSAYCGGNSSGGNGSFSVSVTPPTLTVGTNSTYSYSITLASENGWTGEVTITKNGGPAGGSFTYNTDNYYNGIDTYATVNATASSPDFWVNGGGRATFTYSGNSGASIQNYTINFTAQEWSNSSNNVSSNVTLNISAPVNGACGTANKTYSSSQVSFGSDTFCASGTANPASQSFPAPGATTNWTCVGVSGGTNASCSAIHLQDNSVCSNLTVANVVAAGSVVPFTVAMQNNGTSNWTGRSIDGNNFYYLGIDPWGSAAGSGHATDFGQMVYIDLSAGQQTVSPGQTANFDGANAAYQVRAPSTPGTYTFSWKMGHQGAAIAFGPACSRSITTAGAPTVVVENPTAGASVSGTVPILGYVVPDPSVSITKVEFWTNSNPVLRASSDPASPNYVAGFYPVAHGAQGNTGFNYNFDSFILPNGSHDFIIKAYDSVGNVTTQTVTATVTNSARISLFPTSFAFAGTSGSSTPLAQAISIGNSGGATLNWSASTNQTWCHVASASGFTASAATSTIAVTVDAPTAALVGVNNCTITVSDAAASNSPRTASVQYTVVPGNPGTSTNSHYACSGTACVSTAGAGANTCGGDLACGATTDDGGPSGGVAVSTDVGLCEKIILNWVAGNGATVYRIYRNTTNTVPGSLYKGSVTFSLTENYPTDISLTPTNYYYWVESATGAGGNGNKIPADSNATGGAAATSCTPPPSTPTNPANCNSQSSCPNGGGTPACAVVRLQWRDNSTNEDSFKIYRNTINSFPGGAALLTVNSTSKAGTGQIYNQDTTPPDTNPYYYWVTAYNNAGVESTTAAFGSAASFSCVAQLGTTDKEITGINNSTLSHSDCNGISAPLPTYITPRRADVLSFAINVCNNNGASPASLISVTDNLINLKQPAAGFNAKYAGANLTYDGTCAGVPNPAQNHYCASGSAPNQVLTFNLSTVGDNVAVGASKSITYDAQLDVPLNFSGLNARFQNNAVVSYYNGASNTSANAFNPLQLFIVGTGAPTIIEQP